MKILVLSSGGVDSTTCVGIAVDRVGKENVATASIYYGQKLADSRAVAVNNFNEWVKFQKYAEGNL